MGVAADETRNGPMELRLKFGKQAYCVIEIRRGEEAGEVAKKLRELADQVAGLKKPHVRSIAWPSFPRYAQITQNPRSSLI